MSHKGSLKGKGRRFQGIIYPKDVTWRDITVNGKTYRVPDFREARNRIRSK